MLFANDGVFGLLEAESITSASCVKDTKQRRPQWTVKQQGKNESVFFKRMGFTFVPEPQ